MLRIRSAKLDLDHLRVLRESDSDAATELNLFGNASFSLVSPMFDPTTAGYSLSGDLEGVPLGTATLVVVSRIFSVEAQIHFPH